MSVEQTEPSSGCVVVGVDGSESSKQALLWAAFLAAETSGILEAVVAWVPHTAWGVMATGPGGVLPSGDPASDAGRGLTATVSEVFAGHEPQGLSLRVREGNPVQVLIEASQNARVLVVGSRGHGGFNGLLLGSVSAACAQYATCPVMVVHGDTPPPVVDRSVRT